LLVDHAIESGDPAIEIVNYAQGHEANLIALSTHGRSGVQRWVYGSVAEKVLTLAREPVLLARSNGQFLVPPAAVENILVPLDGSELAEAALPLARTLASALGVPLTLLRAVYVPTYAFSGDPIVGIGADVPELLNVLLEEAQKYLERISGDMRKAGLSVQSLVEVGGAATSIINLEQRLRGCLVIMGTHGRSGVSGTLLGSVARQVLRSDSPTITVPPGVMRRPQRN
jgi:nucleotide-binding universal stress UspA family protein